MGMVDRFDDMYCSSLYGCDFDEGIIAKKVKLAQVMVVEAKE